jgi:hypothetical protein
MKNHKIKLYTFTYTIDFLVLFLFFAVFFDIISTSFFVGLNVGTEPNFILEDLISISFWFIPIYLLSTNAIFIPFLSSVLRKTLCFSLGLLSLLLGVNNFSLVLFDYAVLIDTIGFNLLVILCVLLGLTIFFHFLKKEKINKKEMITTSLKLFLFCLFLALIHFLFITISWLLG